MLGLSLITGPDAGLVHELVVRLSADVGPAVMAHDLGVSETLEWLDDLKSNSEPLQVLLTLPWERSVNEWLGDWKRSTHCGPLSKKYTITTIALGIRVGELQRSLSNGTLVGEQPFVERLLETIEVSSHVVLDQNDAETVHLCRALQPEIRPVVLPEAWPKASSTGPRAAWKDLIDAKTIKPPFGAQYHLFQARRPLNHQRFDDWLRQPHLGLVRARGFAWVEERPELVLEVSISGAHRAFRPAGTWWIGMRRSHWPREVDHLKRIQSQWHPDFGDRLQAIGIIGYQCNLTPIVQALEDCLATDEELGTNWEQLAMVPDPFPGL